MTRLPAGEESAAAMESMTPIQGGVAETQQEELT